MGVRSVNLYKKKINLYKNVSVAREVCQGYAKWRSVSLPTPMRI